MQINIDATIQDAQQKLLNVITQAGTQIIEQMQIAVKSELIKSMNGNNNEYGKISIEQVVQFPQRQFVTGHACGHNLQRHDMYDSKKINVLDYIQLHADEYFIFQNIVDNKKAAGALGSTGRYSSSCCGYCGFGCCCREPHHHNVCNECKRVINPTSKLGEHSNYCIDCFFALKKCSQYIYFDSGSYYVEYYTNFCNKYVLKMMETTENSANEIVKGGNVYIEMPIKTNVRLNKIFIDLLKLSNFDNNIFEFVSNVVSKYWNSNELGDCELRYEKTCADMQQLRQQFEALKLEFELKTSETERLKQENDNLKKQLDDIELFKKCVAMMQTQQVSDASQHCQSTQIGSPL